MQDEIIPLLEELKQRVPALHDQVRLWPEISGDSLYAVAERIHDEGDARLHQGDPLAFSLFLLARLLVNNDRSLLLKQALSLAGRKDNLKALFTASSLFQELSTPEGDPFHFWRSWADLLLILGLYYESSDYFQQAHDCYQKASIAAKASSVNPDLSQMYWSWGKVWVAMARASGEALDFSKASSLFESAHKAGLSHDEFWWEYGEVLWNLGSLLRREQHSIEALEKFLKSAALMPDETDRWLGVARCARQLLETLGEEEYYQIATESLEVLTQLEPDHFEAWLEWGKIESTAGKLFRKDSQQYFESSFEKFAKAETREPNNGSLLAAWAETELCLAIQQESLDLLKRAEVKARRAITLSPDDPDCWHTLGTVLNELGNYFKDERFFVDAIQQFRHGLKIDKQHPLLWYGCALAHFSIGEVRSDAAFVKQAVGYCERVIELGGSPFPQFWNDWGVALLKYGELTGKKESIESAVEKFEKAIELVPDDDSVELEWLYNYGSALDLLGDFSDDEKLYYMAAVQLKKVVEADPSHFPARYNLALALVHLGEVTTDVEPIEEAIRHFETLARHDFEDELIHSDWGYALLTLSQLIDDPAHPELSQKMLLEAEAALQRGIALGCVTSWYYLACLHALSGRPDEAIHHLILCEEKGILPPLEEVMHDEWLESLHNTQGFKNFISGLGLQSREDQGAS